MSTKRILVTGINGFVGKHLARELKNQNLEIIGTASESADPQIAGLLTDFVACDLTNLQSVKQIDFTNVTSVIHLAALSNLGMSFDQPAQFINGNSQMVINLFESILAQKLANNPRFIMVSTGAVYDPKQTMPITENGALTHGSPYAISKILGEMLGDYYEKRGINCVVARPFNHTGPGQGQGFILPDMVKQLNEIGEGGTLKVGNINTRRDYSDVRDVVKAYALLATTPKLKHNLYNICSGASHSGKEIINMIAQELFGKNAKINIEEDQTKIRPNDPPEIFGSNKLVQLDTGWQATIPLKTTVKDYVAWYLKNN